MTELRVYTNFLRLISGECNLCSWELSSTKMKTGGDFLPVPSITNIRNNPCETSKKAVEMLKLDNRSTYYISGTHIYLRKYRVNLNCF